MKVKTKFVYKKGITVLSKLIKATRESLEKSKEIYPENGKGGECFVWDHVYSSL